MLIPFVEVIAGNSVHLWSICYERLKCSGLHSFLCWGHRTDVSNTLHWPLKYYPRITWGKKCNVASDRLHPMFTQPTSLPYSSRKIPEKKMKTLLNCFFHLIADFYFVIKIFIDDSTWLLCPQTKMALVSPWKQSFRPCSVWLQGGMSTAS